MTPRVCSVGILSSLLPFFFLFCLSVITDRGALHPNRPALRLHGAIQKVVCGGEDTTQGAVPHQLRTRVSLQKHLSAVFLLYLSCGSFDAVPLTREHHLAQRWLFCSSAQGCRVGQATGGSFALSPNQGPGYIITYIGPSSSLKPVRGATRTKRE